MAKAKLFIFDEATNNLDSFSEKKLHDLIFKKMPNTIAILIAHRLSTIMSCDHICFLEKGEILEQGTHEELIAMNGKYAKMIALQNINIITQKQGKKEEDENINNKYKGGIKNDNSMIITE